MKTSTIALTAILCTTARLIAAGPAAPAPYTAVEVDRFVAAPGVAFPTDYQNALAEDIAREISLAFQTVIILRQGQGAPYDHAVLRISGVVTRFKPGNKAKRTLIGFGAGATVVETKVWFIDDATGQVLLNREVKGTTWAANRDSESAGDSLAKKIVKFCNSAHLLESN
jgi:hypothetical protein